MNRNILSTFALALVGAIISYLVVAFSGLDTNTIIFLAFAVFGILIFVRSFLRASN
ncbi:hypothetical protein SAMN05421858_1948 [Haladaptatus litoreus]|uniref:Uncharacterized protein n=1 Tax=Haladaptatus litoreus TaxID=553468 RepID=A0A1N6ZAR5_9EURY|nr:hypothetical protein SAMN05421858_1948 [Haladaptatus litoreus]